MSDLIMHDGCLARWDDSTAPGGLVCAVCGTPVESEPCAEHAPYAEALAAVLPEHERQVRERLAEEIEGNQGPLDPGDDHDRGVLTAIAIIGGEAITRPETDACRTYDDGHGSTVSVRGSEPLTDADQAAMREIVGAARRKYAEEKAAEFAKHERQVRAKVAEEILEQGGGGTVLWRAAIGTAADIARGRS